MRNQRFGFILCLALGVFGFAAKAQAQTVLADRLNLPSVGVITINNNYNPVIGRFQASTQSTVTQVTFEISDFAPPNNIGTLFSQSTLTVGGTAQSFVKLGYQADVSRAGTANAYALDDHTTLYHFRPEDTDAMSLSHATLALGGDIDTLDGWQLQAGLALDAYEAGTIGRLTLSAGRQF